MSRHTRHWTKRAHPYNRIADSRVARTKITAARKNPCTSPSNMMWEARSCLMGIRSKKWVKVSISLYRSWVGSVRIEKVPCSRHHPWLSSFLPGNIIHQLFRAFQENPYDLKGAVALGIDMPFDQGDFPMYEFEAGNAPGMYAAAVVEKGDLSGFREPGPVGMSRNGDQKLFLQDPTFDPPFDPDELLVVLGRVGGVGNAPDL